MYRECSFEFFRDRETTIKIKFALSGGGGGRWAYWGEREKSSKTRFFVGNATTINLEVQILLARNFAVIAQAPSFCDLEVSLGARVRVEVLALGVPVPEASCYFISGGSERLEIPANNDRGKENSPPTPPPLQKALVTILFKIISRVKLLFSNYLGDYTPAITVTIL